MSSSKYASCSERDYARERERLSLLCHADRVRLRLIVESATKDKARTPTILHYATEALHAASVMPGRLGRWSNRLLFGIQLGKTLGVHRWVRF